MLLSVQNLSFSYGSRPILRDLAMQLHEGELVALLGANGSGKTTLIRCLLNFVTGPGAIEWNEKSVRHWSRNELAKVVGYLPQSPTYEPGQSVFDVLRLGRSPYWKMLGLETDHDARVVREIAQSMGLTELLDIPVDRLSGGQRQRVFIGRCLVQEPRALLLDEPATHLDLKHQVDLLQVLRKLAKERGLGILVSSHELNLAAQFADRVMLLSDGRILADGAANEVMTVENLERVYGMKMRREGTFVFPVVDNI